MVVSIRDRCKESNLKLDINAVMTDDDLVSGNSIKEVFGREVRHLLCEWHVKRNWQKNIKNKINSQSLRQLIEAGLNLLFEERNENEFRVMLHNFMLHNQHQCPQFINYFSKFYASRYKLWAKCFRNFSHGATDTNMYCESFHNKLKTFYMQRKHNKRVDNLIEILLLAEK